MSCASFSMLDGPAGTGWDVPVRGCRVSRDVIVAAVYDFVKDCMGFVMYLIIWYVGWGLFIVFVYLICTWHRKASAKTQVSLTRFLQSEVKIIHIIVQNNTYYSARSGWRKQQQTLDPFIFFSWLEVVQRQACNCVNKTAFGLLPTQLHENYGWTVTCSGQ